MVQNIENGFGTDGILGERTYLNLIGYLLDIAIKGLSNDE